MQRERGRIDVLFASAGVAEMGVPIGEISEAHFDKTFDLNVRGTLFTVQKALPLLVDGGSVIMNGSIASAKGFADAGVYSATKAAIHLRHRRIRVNVLSPGTIDTAAFDGVRPTSRRASSR